MHLRPTVLTAAAFVWGAVVTSAPHAADVAVRSQVPISQAAEWSAPRVGSILSQYCGGCHNTQARAGGFVLDPIQPDPASLDAEVWEKVARKLRTRTMPPSGLPRPDETTYAGMTSWLTATLDTTAIPNPGRPILHRLNRTEYANAIRDLLALEVDSSSLFPPDDSADGFDTNAALLGASPVLLERYLSAASKVSAWAVGDPEIGASSETYRVPGHASQTDHVEGLPLGTRGGLMVRHTFPLDGQYSVNVKLVQTSLGAIRGLEHPHQVEILVDGSRVQLATVGGPADFAAASSPGTASALEDAITRRLSVRLPVKAGQRLVGATFLAKTAAAGADRIQPFLRSTVSAGTDHTGVPHIERLTITGPFEGAMPADTPTRRQIFICRPGEVASGEACARQIISKLATRAYRRPIAEREMERLLEFYRVGHRERGFDRGIQLALRAILASPNFVFRIEGNGPAGAAPGTSYAIDDLELASRLSFFIWSSIPDDELLTIAAAGTLGDPAVLKQQVMRMLADPRSEALVENFAGQWLHLRNLRSSSPDRYAFPNVDANLLSAFEREVELFFESVMREDRSVLDLLTADDTFLNERLARHYGIPHVYGSHFRRVTLEDETRRGLLGKGGILTLTSHPDRTSPVVRGQWILENLLGTPPPPAPANVPPLADANEGEPRTMRERMELHRASPACASCHRIMDPLGLALENFDAVGVWRTHEAGRPIDATGELTDGTVVEDVTSLRNALVRRPENFVHTMTEKLLTFALRRGLEYYDMPAVRSIVRAAARDDYRFSSLVLGVVNSVPFRQRLKPSSPEAPAAGETIEQGGRTRRR